MDCASNKGKDNKGVSEEDNELPCYNSSPESSEAELNTKSPGRVALEIVKEAGGGQFTNSVGELYSVQYCVKLGQLKILLTDR